MKVQVLLPKVFNFPFTYNSNKIKINVGDFVEIPFGLRKEFGVVWKNTYNEPEKIKIKNIIKKIDNYSLDKKLLDFIEWFSVYNMVPIGLVLKMVIGGNDNFFKKNDDKIEIKKKKYLKYSLNREQLDSLKFLESVAN